MQEQVDQGALAGISTLVARKGKVVYFEQFGDRDRENKLPMQADTIFRLYSMTKPIVCTAFMSLYERGKFDLKTPISDYILAFAQLKVLETDSTGKERLVDLKQPLTIHHLLTHTSGLTYDFYEEYPVCKLYRDNRLLADAHNGSLEEFVDKICQFPLAFQPGSRWHYSVSIDVIARLIKVLLTHF
jgi:CubicO group peptidase (beta-lactamase class C family)